MTHMTVGHAPPSENGVIYALYTTNVSTKQSTQGAEHEYTVYTNLQKDVLLQ